MVEPTELAWAGGLFDGEGSIEARTGNLRLAMTDPDSVYRFHRAVTYGSVVHRKPSGLGIKPLYQWSLKNYHEKLMVLHVLMPWLSERRLETIGQVPLPGPNTHHCFTRHHWPDSEGR